MDADGPLLAGRFRLGPRLGGGSQGETFLARDERPDERPARDGARLCVVKRMIPRGTWKAFELFEREGKVLSQLRHPGVPRTLATFEEPPGTFNLVMERMPGDNLRALTARRRLAGRARESGSRTSNIRISPRRRRLDLIQLPQAPQSVR